MTFFEHAMLGGSLAIAAGLADRHGWRIAAMAGVAAMSPDWDGLTFFFGPQAYTLGHRIWGHNLVVACVMGAGIGLVECRHAILMRGWTRVSRRVAV